MCVCVCLLLFNRCILCADIQKCICFHPVIDKRFYRERKSFLCIDGSKVIPFEQVNDDYCDCEDGSDEPGEQLRERVGLPMVCSLETKQNKKEDYFYNLLSGLINSSKNCPKIVKKAIFFPTSFQSPK